MSSDFEVPDPGRNDDFWYNFGFDALDLQIESYSVDGSASGTQGLTDSRLEVGSIDWDTLSLSGSITVPEGLEEHIFEDEVDAGEVGSLIVRYQCMQTHHRDIIYEVDVPPTAGTHPVTVDLERESVAGAVTLEPLLVRDHDPELEVTKSYQYGQIPGLKLADGNTFEIVTDDESDDGGFLSIQLTSFGEERGEEYFQLDHGTPDEPTLYINSDVERIARAFQSRAPHGPKRWTKETLKNLIAVPVWTELILWTASDLSDGETQHPWQDSVLEILSESTYKGDDTTEIAEDLEERVADPSRLAYLVEEIRQASQDIVAARRDLENLLEEFY
ncbi:hypothetical protein [Halogranum rubrum]|uniref:Uncharacterized protein n=1 Tax=Halogranum salarium B-1 TaxID=1210908 RepID=J3JDV1_9EURY|nr:hypothetical protein [Halogranum salarium]EJN57809.1 hypothetical protein HSB1_38940 [Halogranum salarium B-1]